MTSKIHGWDERAHGHLVKHERNETVYHLFRSGMKKEALARQFGVSGARINEIIKSQERRKQGMTCAKDIGIAICDGLDSLTGIEQFRWQGDVGTVILERDPVKFKYNDDIRDKLVITTADGAVFRITITQES